MWVRRHAHGLDVEISVHDDRRDPAVYAWVVEREIIYIGVAGNGVRARMKQHANGMKRPGRGGDHATYLADLNEKGLRPFVYAMWPPPTMFGEWAIPSHLSVESWLIKNIEPRPVRNFYAAADCGPAEEV